MGRNNQQRRAAKKRRRQRQRERQSQRQQAPAAGRRPRPGPTEDRVRPEELLHAATQAWGADDATFERLLDLLSARAAEIVPMVEQALAHGLGELWGRGWTPVDLVQVATRRFSSDHGALAAGLAVADGRSRRQQGERLHPRWEAQLAGLEEGGADGATLSGGPLRWSVELLCLVLRLAPVPQTVPPPGTQADRRWDQATGLDERILARVRALLAKAESTPFDEEAEALTAKAQELITRHALDDALLHADDEVGDPSVRRIPVDPPYVSAKAVLLTEVGDANRCRVVHSPSCGWVTVIGYDADLDAVELLSASLLAQATAAMSRQGPRRDAAGRSRTRSFRRSFLLGFACRIGERLRETSEAEVAATDADRLLPVLAARDDRVDAAVEEAFPALEHSSGTIGNGAGFEAGRAAAELADLRLRSGRLPDARVS